MLSKAKIRAVIFGTRTRAGKNFDLVLLALILFSLLVVMLESVPSIQAKYSNTLYILEWILTILFTLEYGLRLYSAPKPREYALSYFGIIDLLAIIPTYLSLIITGGSYFAVVRGLRLLRVFRVLKLVNYSKQAQILSSALAASKEKIIVFCGSVLAIVAIMGTVMYAVEGAENGFSSIPRSMYWAIVTLTTVGYGDIAPQTILGQLIASVIMILGYGIIAVPTGIVSVELAKASDSENSKMAQIELNDKVCNICDAINHENDAKYCKHCGADLTD